MENYNLFFRNEERFILPTKNNFINYLNRNFLKINFSENNYLQSIYLNTDDHILPFYEGVRVRRYLLKPELRPKLNYNDYFLVETGGLINGKKRKIRYSDKFKNVIKLWNKKFITTKSKFRPYLMTQCKREHYIPKTGKKLRITIDSEITYFYFKNKSIATRIAKEDFLRIEIKFLKESRLIKSLKSFLIKNGALSTISKRTAMYNYHVKYVEKTSKKIPINEIKGFEFESKFVLNSEKKFYKIRNLFHDGLIKGFRIQKCYPYVLEGGMSVSYFKDKRNNIYRIVQFGGFDIIITKKGKDNNVNDNKSFVLERREIRQRMSYKDFLRNVKLIGFFIRLKKVFWVENIKTNRIYHIAVDHNLSNNNKKLCQLEIEYAGSHNPQKDKVKIREEILQDISYLNDLLARQFQWLKQSNLTKLEWIIRNK